MLFTPPGAIAVFWCLAPTEMLLAVATHHRHRGDEKQKDNYDSFGFHLASQSDGFNVSVP